VVCRHVAYTVFSVTGFTFDTPQITDNVTNKRANFVNITPSLALDTNIRVSKLLDPRNLKIDSKV